MSTHLLISNDCISYWCKLHLQSTCNHSRLPILVYCRFVVFFLLHKNVIKWRNRRGQATASNDRLGSLNRKYSTVHFNVVLSMKLRICFTLGKSRIHNNLWQHIVILPIALRVLHKISFINFKKILMGFDVVSISLSFLSQYFSVCANMTTTMTIIRNCWSMPSAVALPLASVQVAAPTEQKRMRSEEITIFVRATN